MRRLPSSYIIFSLLAICLLLAAALIDSTGDKYKLPADIIKDLGIVVAAVVVVEFLWKGFGGDPLSHSINALHDLIRATHAELSQSSAVSGYAERNGVIGIYSRSADFNSTQWGTLIARCQHDIHLSALTLHQFSERRDLLEALKGRIVAGVAVRVLVCGPDNPVLSSAGGYDSETLDTMRTQMRQSLATFDQLRQSLPSEYRSKLRIWRVDHGMMDSSIRRFDNTLYVVPYVYGKRTPECPLIVLSDDRKPWFVVYQQAFEMLVESASEVPEQIPSPNV
jgi:hypothetical protein